MGDMLPRIKSTANLAHTPADSLPTQMTTTCELTDVVQVPVNPELQMTDTILPVPTLASLPAAFAHVPAVSVHSLAVPTCARLFSQTLQLFYYQPHYQLVHHILLYTTFLQVDH